MKEKLYDKEINKILEKIEPSIYSFIYIDQEKIAKNYSFLKKKIKVNCASVVKADAYGLGCDVISRRLYKEGCRSFFVAYLDEGIALRENILKFTNDNPDIYVLNGFFNGCESYFLHNNLIPVVTDLSQIESWKKFSLKLDIIIPIALHLDTGLHRTGLSFKNIKHLYLNPKKLNGLSIKLIMSHLACADNINNEFNSIQKKKLYSMCNFLPKAPISLSNSSGIFLGQSYHFDLVRPGMALYGLNPTQNLDNPMKPVISLWSRIYQIKTVKKYETVGYSRTYVTNKSHRIAIITLGYADGIPWLLSNKGFVDIFGYKCMIIGRVSMDLLTIDISSIPNNLVSPGQWIQILGPSLQVGNWSLITKTLSYEILFRFGKRLKRIYNSF